MDAVDKATQKYETTAYGQTGFGEFIEPADQTGSDREQRDKAREHYESIIREAETAPEFQGRNLGETWRAIRDHWRGTLEKIKALSRRHSQRLASGHSPIPAPVAKLMGLMLKGKVTVDEVINAG
jgi:hypothetical protein